MKICKQCRNAFEVTDRDRLFYEKISPVINGKRFDIPEPTLCPTCRARRRFMFRNERNLYQTKSALSGKAIISNVHPDSPWQVYEHEEWFGDEWDAGEFGRAYDFDIPFFQQLYELQLQVPILNLNLANNENCSYCNYVAASKNSYLIFGSVYSEECFYGNPYSCKNCVDSLLVRDSELCYQCITCERCYECMYCQDCVSGRNLLMCYDCQNCSDCIGCAGLRGKQYCIYNTQFSPENYEAKRRALDLLSDEQMRELESKFTALCKTIPHRYAVLVNTEHCTGDYIYNSKNTYHAFDVQRSEDAAYLAQTIDLKDCYDCNYTEENELCYEYIAHYQNQHCMFSNMVHQCNNLMYSGFCLHSSDLFGCVGMKHKQYCILNKQYSKEEYNELLSRIIAQLQKEGVWGEFFSPELSYFCYNESVAQEYFPLNKEEAQAQNLKWRDAETKEYQKQTVEIPKDIARVTDAILNALLACETCGKNYKLIAPELEFYRNYHLPVPVLCPDCRHKGRLQKRNKRVLHDRSCSSCGIALQSTYAPERAESVLCEACYLKERY
jgi:hypothetical protein